MTLEADQEIHALQLELQRLRDVSNSLFDKAQKYPYNSYERKAFISEQRKIDTKFYKLEEKISDIKKLKLSSKQQSGLKREIGTFRALQHSSSLGSRDRIVVGYSKALGQYVIVTYTSFNSFMRNVRGCSSLAGTKDINDIRYISKQQYDNITSQPRREKHKRMPAATNLGGVFG